MEWNIFQSPPAFDVLRWKSIYILREKDTYAGHRLGTRWKTLLFYYFKLRILRKNASTLKTILLSLRLRLKYRTLQTQLKTTGSYTNNLPLLAKKELVLVKANTSNCLLVYFSRLSRSSKLLFRHPKLIWNTGKDVLQDTLTRYYDCNPNCFIDHYLTWVLHILSY